MQPGATEEKEGKRRRPLLKWGLITLGVLFVIGAIGNIIDPRNPGTAGTTGAAATATVETLAAAPGETNTSRPPAATNTPAPPAPPTETLPPLTTEGAMRQAIAARSQGVEVTSLEYQGTSVNVRFKVQDRIISRESGTQLDVTDMLRAIHESAPADYTQTWIVGTFPLQDKLGNVSDGQVLNLTYDRAVIDKINWDNFQFKNVYDIADKAIVHPDLQP